MQPQDCPDDREVLETAMEAGHILLENGAEIFRVEETMERIAAHYGVERKDFFVLSNGIFTTGDCGPGQRGGQYARVQHIPVKSAQLDRVVAVNQLSREIEAAVTPWRKRGRGCGKSARCLASRHGCRCWPPGWAARASAVFLAEARRIVRRRLWQAFCCMCLCCGRGKGT